MVKPKGTRERTFSERSVHSIDPPVSGRLWCRPADPASPKGFRLMITANGYRAYYVVYRARGIRRGRAYPIGPAEDFSYREAFKKAESIRWLVADGRDPFGEQREAADRKRSLRIVTVRDALDYFIEVHKDQRDVKTTQAYEQTRNALPSSFLQEIAESVAPASFRKSIREVTDVPVMQNRHLSRLKAVLRFAYGEQYIPRAACARLHEETASREEARTGALGR